MISYATHLASPVVTVAQSHIWPVQTDLKQNIYPVIRDRSISLSKDLLSSHTNKADRVFFYHFAVFPLAAEASNLN